MNYAEAMEVTKQGKQVTAWTIDGGFPVVITGLGCGMLDIKFGKMADGNWVKIAENAGFEFPENL